MEETVREMQQLADVSPENVLGLVTKINRISRLLAKPSDRDNISKSNIKNAASIYSMVLNVLVSMSNKDEKLITTNLQENLETLMIALKMLIDRDLEEYDSQSISKAVKTFDIVKSNVYWIIGKWFTVNDLGDTVNGDYENILKEVIVSCVNRCEFLGV